MKKLIIILISLSSFLAFSQDKSRPNIVLFVVDDLGWQDISVPLWNKATKTNQIYKTPNLEKLANGGFSFTNAYNTPVCTPTRVSMITGMNAANHQVLNWTHPFYGKNTNNPDPEMKSVDWNIHGLSPQPNVEGTVYATPLPEILKENGYFTIHVGKAHWASNGTPGSNPKNLGFLVNIAGGSAGHPQSYYGEKNYGNKPDNDPQAQAVQDLQEFHGTDTFLTEALSLETLKALEWPIQKKHPFFLHFSNYAVHTPIMGDPRFTQKYLDAGLEKMEADYASLIEGVDKALGDLMQFLEEKREFENTIILFTSDNGGLALSPPRAKPSHEHNLPLRSGKGSVYEGGIRNPLIVYYPFSKEKNIRIDQPVIVEDIFPTILEMASIEKAKYSQKIDGKSWLEYLMNPSKKLEERTFIWHYPIKWTNEDGPGINFYSAIRKGDWKLVYSWRKQSYELYNLITDISEETDLKTKNPEKAQELYQDLMAQLKDYQAPLL